MATHDDLISIDPHGKRRGPGLTPKKLFRKREKGKAILFELELTKAGLVSREICKWLRGGRNSLG